MNNLTPITREEMFLADIAEAQGGGSGGGGLLVRAVTEDLGAQGVKYSLDKTFGEIKNAMDGGGAIIIVVEDTNGLSYFTYIVATFNDGDYSITYDWNSYYLGTALTDYPSYTS